MKIKTTPKIIKIAAEDGVSINEEIEIAIGLYCSIRSLTLKQQEFINGYIQEHIDDH